MAFGGINRLELRNVFGARAGIGVNVRWGAEINRHDLKEVTARVIAAALVAAYNGKETTNEVPIPSNDFTAIVPCISSMACLVK